MSLDDQQDFEITPNEKGLRLDVYLSQVKASVTRSQIKRMIEEEQVRINGKKTKPGYRLRLGDIVTVETRAPIQYHAVPENIPLQILYEDQDLIVIDKPSGMVVHPAAGNYNRTLVNAVLYHCKDLAGIGGQLRPGIVHRLDKDTSGLIVLAKSEKILNDLQRQFKEHHVKKIYNALVLGNVQEDTGVIDLPVGRHPADRKKMSTISKRGKQALTRWRVLERFGFITFLELQIDTGRTHQIRVHLNAIGHPVLGDTVYGNAARKIQTITANAVRSRLKMMKRQALHAGALSFIHPATKKYVEFSSPIPEDIMQQIEFFRYYVYPA